MKSSLRSRGLLILVALTLVVVSSACGSSADRGTRETGLTQAFQTLLPKGRILANDLSASEPVAIRNAWVFENEIVVEGAMGDIYSLDRMNLASRWYYDGMVGPIEFEPTPSPISFLFVSGGNLYEVSRNLGNQVRGAIPLHFVASAAPAATASTAYIPCLAAGIGRPTLITVNLATGIEGWRVATRSSVMSAPVRGGSETRPMIYFAEENQGLFAYPADSSGRQAPDPAWARLTHGRNHQGPVVVGDLILIGSDQGDFWALDRVTGGVAWSVMSGAPLLAKPWASGDQVYFVNSRGFHVHAREDGRHLWTYEAGGEFLVRRPDAVYVDAGNGTVHALDVNTGELLRSVEFGEGVTFLSNMMDGMFYAVTADGFVMAVDTGI
jgi:outer membrane protein assembly factor BamB